ncbi:hypothetical protein J4772_01800 [Cohnella sp. LGH]|uniref:nucleotidyltransferase domain-containing protein n=1 Tax=Cohnella sp. LGH TaxID=1619153 RepID=UPI001ADBE392|nr:hypothetical protein [Cohnella sp. LGH]QTH43230.1 hypothetical protein J4772_01800 [Cohnella sp. LGH]
MRTDIDNWTPLTVSEIGAIFSEIPITWCIAGGWALDLYLGRQSRKHADIDIIVLREQQAIAFQHLSKGWQLYKAEEGKLALCKVDPIVKTRFLDFISTFILIP